MTSKSKKTIYIAGPMRGYPKFNFPAFDEAKEELSKNWNVISPADIDRAAGFSEDGDEPDSTMLRNMIERDLDAIIWKCDAIALLPGWQRSRGAKVEKALAEFLGLEIFYYMNGYLMVNCEPNEFMTEVKFKNDECILDEAKRLQGGDRQNSYGPPDQDFARTAKMWEAILGAYIEDGELSIPPAAVSLCMIALKLSRETHQHKRDNWVDIAGYAKCGHICRECEDKE